MEMKNFILTMAILLSLECKRIQSFSYLSLTVKAWKIGQTIRQVSLSTYDFVMHPETETMRYIKDFGVKIKNVESVVQMATEEMKQSIGKMAKDISLERDLEKFTSEITKINRKYKNFISFSNQNRKYNNYALNIFAKSVLDPNLGISTILDDIHSMYQRIVDKFLNPSKTYPTQICGQEMSLQFSTYNFYATLLSTYSKGNVILGFAFNLLSANNLGSFETEINDTLTVFYDRVKEIEGRMEKDVMESSRDLWVCDPEKHVRDVTYAEVASFQTFVVNQAQLFDDKTLCLNNCERHQLTRMDPNGKCATGKCDSLRGTCDGSVMHCQTISSSLKVCNSDETSNRRYEFIKLSNGTTLGQEKICKQAMNSLPGVSKYFINCNYCACTCEKRLKTTRYFDLREVTSDVEDNKVITGIRLRKIDYVFYIQIQQGILMPNGTIDESSVEWKPVNNYTVWSEEKGFNEELQFGKDYHPISYAKSGVFLEDLETIDGHLLTGVQFQSTHTSNLASSAYLRLKIRMTAFDFNKGQLNSKYSSWHFRDEDDYIHDRTEINLEGADDPTNVNSHSYVTDQTDHYVLFRPTDLLEDAGQSTVPFLDIQPIEPKPHVPLSGVGIFLKRALGSGGFLSLKLITNPLTSRIADVSEAV